MHLWFEEADKRVWHLMTRREGPVRYHAITGRIWPSKTYERGPPEEERCRTCVGKE